MTAEHRFLGRVVDWAAASPGVLAVGLVGSRARGTATASSDVDLVLLVDDVPAWLRRRDWIGVLGKYRMARDEDWGAVTSRRVDYLDGVEAEFGFTTKAWAAAPLDEGAARVIRAGLEILYDPSRLLEAAVVHAAGGGTPSGADHQRPRQAIE